MNRRLPLLSLFPILTLAVSAQYTPPDTAALEDILVETYYVCDASDAGDVDGGPGLNAGAVVYRVFADLKPGYSVETIYGSTAHPMSMTTSTVFWNNTDRGEATGDLIPENRLDENTVAIDSWISVGAASDAHWGVMKDEDPDGSIVGGSNNDGGSNGVPGGLLVNADVNAGLPLTTADGLLAGTVPSVTTIGLDLAAFEDQSMGTFSSTSGGWSVLGGTTGADPAGSNMVLLAQITTDGTFAFELNMRVGIPDSLQCASPLCHTFIDYYATLLPADTAGGGIPADNQVGFPGLTYQSGQLADCEGVVGGPALPGTPCDDGDPNTVTEWDANCDCVVLNVGIADQDGPFTGISIHPNPANDMLQVSFALSDILPVRLELLDVLGQTVLGRDLGPRSGELRETLDLSGLSSGAYFLELRAGGRSSTHRVVKY